MTKHKTDLPNLLLREAISSNRTQVQRDTNFALGVQRLTLECMADILEQRGIVARPQIDALKVEILEEYKRRLNEQSKTT